MDDIEVWVRTLHKFAGEFPGIPILRRRRLKHPERRVVEAHRPLNY